MKKFLFILCSIFLLTGCGERVIESSISETIPESAAELQTAAPTESETEEVTETTRSNVYEKQTYRELLENIYYNREFPDWDYKNYDKDVSIDFAVYDIDSDGRDELLVTFDNRSIYVYDHNSDGNIVKQFSGYIKSDFYENGAVRVYSAHNQTHSLKVHPFSMHEYDKETDSYNETGIVYGLDRDIVDMINQEKKEVGMTDFLDYPAEYDKSNSGTVYYICPDWSNDAGEPLDVTEYNEYYEHFTENADIIDIPFMELTEKNIKKVSENNLNVTEISDNIKLYDLTVPENSELIPDEKILYSLYPNDIEMAGYGIISNEDGNIKLVKDNGEKNTIIESPYPDKAYSWIRTEFPIDGDRFAYSACGEWGNIGFGVYDMKSGENHIVMESYYPKVVRENSLILAEAEDFNTVGYSEFDLDSYEIRDIPIQVDLENLKYYRTNDVSADGRLAAVMRYEDNSYIITVISLESGEVMEEYILETDYKYGNMELEFASDNKLHLYAKRNEDNTYHLYVFDIA